MNIQDNIQIELNKLSEQQLNTIYSLVKELTKNSTESLSIMDKLKEITINEDENFSKNIAKQLGRDIFYNHFI